MAVLRIFMLGPFRVLRDEEPIPPSAWRSQQTRTILKVLVARRGYVVPADQLLEILWPDGDPHTARRRLHVRISQLRHALDPDGLSAYILTAKGGYIFNPEADCWLDTVEFEARAEWGRRCQEGGSLAEAITTYETACALYCGNFLQEDLYEDWTFADRERLRERFLTVLTELAECYAQQGRYRRAIARCHQVLATDPCREAVYVRLMLYHYYAGEQAQALHTYERCRQVLADELGVEPLAQTTALCEQIRQRQVLPIDDTVRYPEPVYEERLFEVPYSLGRTPFVGRDGEYAWLVSHVEEAIAGRGGVAVVAGEAGLGKTRLVQEVVDYACRRGVITLEGRCFELGSTLSYQPFIQTLRDYLPTADAQHLRQIPSVWLAEVARLLPELSEVFPDVPPNVRLPPEHQKSRLFEGVAQFIVHISQEQPLVIFLDDLHWADRSTLELLHYVARRIATEKVLVIGTFRSEEVGEDHPLAGLLRGMSREQKLIRLDLPLLSEEAVTELIAQMSHSSAGGRLFSRRIYRETEGNPLFIVAILQNLFEEGVLYVNEEGEWSTDYDASTVDYAELMIPPTIREVIEARLARLDEESRRLLAMASVVGQEFDPDCLRVASSRTEEELFGTLDGLLRRRLIQEESGGRGYRFDHPKVREVAYVGLDAPQRAALHRRVGEALLRLRGKDPAASAELAYHYHQGGHLAEAVRFAIRAGEHALRLYAGQEAASHFENALKWTEEADVTLDEKELALIHFNWGEALRRSGRFDEAMVHYTQALPLAQRELKQSIALQMCSVAAIQGGSVAQFSHLVPELEQELAEAGDTWALVSLRWTQGYLAAYQGEATHAWECFAASLRMARRLVARGDEPPGQLEARAYIGLARCHELWADWRCTIRYAKKALTIYTAVNDLSGIGASHTMLGAAHYGLGEWDEALRHLDYCYNLAADAGDLRTQGDVLYWAGLIYLEWGDWATVEDHAQRILTAAESTGDLLRLAFGQSLLARLSMRRGAPDEAIPVLQSHEQMARAADAGVFAAQAVRHLAEAHLLAGDPQAALVTACEGIELTRQCGLKREQGGSLRILGESLAQSGKFAKVECHLLHAEGLAQRIGCRYDLAQARRSLGVLRQKQGLAQKAKESLEAALAAFSDLGARYDMAVTQRLLSDCTSHTVERHADDQ